MSEGKKSLAKPDIQKNILKSKYLLLVSLFCVVVVGGVVFGGRRYIKREAGSSSDRYKKLSAFTQVKSTFSKEKTYAPGYYILEGIIYEDKNSSVIINGMLLKLNERIDNWKVIKVTPTGAELKNIKDNSTLSLSL